MGVVPQCTFNYFARTHGIPADPADAVRLLLRSAPAPVQVAGINDRVFLVNASLGLYPELLEDREAYKARFGRSRWVAFMAACATLLRVQRRFRLHIEMGGRVRDLQTVTLFVGNNRLQLQQLGAEPEDTLAGTPGDGSMAALVLRPIGARRGRWRHRARGASSPGVMDDRDLGSGGAKDRPAPAPGRHPSRRLPSRRRKCDRGDRAAARVAVRRSGVERHDIDAPPRGLRRVAQGAIKAVPLSTPASPRDGAGRGASGWRESPPSRRRCCPAGAVRASGRHRLRLAG